MSTSRICKSFIYNSLYKGLPTITNFKLIEENLRPLSDNEYLAEAVYIRTAPNYQAAACLITPNTTPKATQLAKVTESKNKNVSVGEYVIGNFGWQTHTIVDSFSNAQVYLVPKINNVPKTLSLGVLGMPGIAAYFGFVEIFKPQKNNIVVISSAAGAVGSCVGQIAKTNGCKVIGITSSDEKCSWLMEIGFDHCINYKKDNVKEKLEQYAPEGVDCYFDNVGGELSSCVIYQMKAHGRICVCGATSSYYNDIKVAEIQTPIKVKTLKMVGMHIAQWRNQWELAIRQLSEWFTESKLKTKETIIDGFENVPQTFIDVLKGKYYGNVMIKL